jgi:2-haloalkanoic acid dehalogenase type II
MERWVPKAVLLDFFGTLVENDDSACAEIAKRVATSAEAPATRSAVNAHWYDVFSQMLAVSHGGEFRTQRQLQLESLQVTIAHFGADLDARSLVQLLYDFSARPSILPEVRDVLGRCRLPLCVVSSIDSADLQSALRHNDLHFDHTVTSEDCRSYKPRPEMFERALSLLGMGTSDVLHVGDSVRADVRGAKALGIPVLWINRQRRPVPEGPDRPEYVSHDLTGLVDIIAGRTPPVRSSPT